MRYREFTRDTTERLKRIAHGDRLAGAARLVRLRESDRVLDYGCADGALFDELVHFVPPQNLCGFDPWLLDEMERSDILAYDDASFLIEQQAGAFDAIYCLEVCEHMTAEALAELFANLRRLGKPGALVVFGVPLETGLSGFAKNLYRTVKGNRQEATVGKAFRSLFSRPIERRADVPNWIGCHLGFDHTAFAAQLPRNGFAIERRMFQPWPRLGATLNNEVYYICRLAVALPRSQGATMGNA